MDLKLKGKVGVVTGGSVGIGLAVARSLLKRMNVVLVARNKERSMTEAKTIVEEFGASCCD